MTVRSAVLCLAILALMGCESAHQNRSSGSPGAAIEHGTQGGSGVAHDDGDRIGIWNRESDPLGYGDAP